MPDTIESLRIELSTAQARASAAEAALARAEELHRMQLAGVMTASIRNTEKSKADRIDQENPYWTVAYADVCRTVDREIRERTRAEAAESALAAKTLECEKLKAQLNQK